MKICRPPEEEPTIAETTLTDANTDSSGGRSTLRIQSANWAKPAVWVTTPPKPITAAVLAGLMRRYSQSVNMVNAPYLAKGRGMEVREIRSSKEGTYQTLIKVMVETDAGRRSVSGTLFGREAPRLVEIFGIGIEAELDGNMLYVVNDDAPGFIGRIGSLLGDRGINIGTFNLGRREAGGEAVLLLSIDQPVDDALIAEAEALEGVRTVTALSF